MRTIRRPGERVWRIATRARGATAIAIVVAATLPASPATAQSPNPSGAARSAGACGILFEDMFVRDPSTGVSHVPFQWIQWGMGPVSGARWVTGWVTIRMAMMGVFLPNSPSAQLFTECLGPTNPSTRSSPLGLCAYRVRALQRAGGGDGATFMSLGATKMIMFPEGQIIFTGSGPGSYPVGEARGTSDGQGATLVLDDGFGGVVPLSTADGGTENYMGRTIQMPPAATLIVTHMDADEIEGSLTGKFFVSGMAAGRLQQFDQVQVTVDFRAAAATGASACP